MLQYTLAKNITATCQQDPTPSSWMILMMKVLCSWELGRGRAGCGGGRIDVSVLSGQPGRKGEWSRLNILSCTDTLSLSNNILTLISNQGALEITALRQHSTGPAYHWPPSPPQLALISSDMRGGVGCRVVGGGLKGSWCLRWKWIQSETIEIETIFPSITVHYGINYLTWSNTHFLRNYSKNVT